MALSQMSRKWFMGLAQRLGTYIKSVTTFSGLPDTGILVSSKMRRTVTSNIGSKIRLRSASASHMTNGPVAVMGLLDDG